MKLLAENLGRIVRAEIELRPLTVFVGENGTNKTWVAQGLFKILERLRRHARQPALASESDSALAAVLNKRAAAIVQRARGTSGEARFEISREDLINELPPELTFGLAHPGWDSALGFTPHKKARLTLSLTRDEFAAGAASTLGLGLSLDPFQLVTDLSLDDDTELTHATYFGVAGTPVDAQEKVREALEHLLFAWRRRVRVMPVEREHLAQIFSWLLTDYRIPMPRALVDFCYLMNEARGRSDVGSTDGDLRSVVHQILRGRFRFAGPTRELVFEPSEPGVGSIPIKASASLGKSLAGLDIFLSSVGPGDFLVIDEPEMNAHPETQLALVELFALMIQAGVQLVLVTHSPYVLDHLGTLVEASRLKDAGRARIVEKLRLKNEGALLRPEQLAVYRFDLQGKVTSIFDQETRSMDLSTFSDVGDAETNLLSDVLTEELARGV
jgi:hypothetical protein